MVDALPGDFGIPALSTLYAEGLPLADLSEGLSTQRAVGQTATADSRFWASPPRMLNDTTNETLVVTLTKPKLINYLSLDLPHFPHHFYIHYWDEKNKAWKSILGDNGYDIRFYIDGSVPHVVGSAAALQQHLHPSHYGADHWVHYDTDIKPFTTSKIRLMGNRGFGSHQGGPVDPAGHPAPYSLGVRNLDFGFRVRRKQDVPLTNRKPDITTERESFTTVTDLLGSPVELSMRENRASDLLNGRIWKSSPQPFSYAVVNLYADARDSSGASQVIDRFDLTPVTSGVRFNLYYSSTPPDVTSFGAVDTPLGFPFTRTAGEVDPFITDDGLRFPSRISFLDVDNQALQWQMKKPFWMGLEILPQFASTETADHVVFDSGPIQLAWRNQSWQLSLDGTSSLQQQPFTFAYNERLYFIVAYDGTNIYFHTPPAGTLVVNADLRHISTATLRFGAELGVAVDAMIDTGSFTLKTLILKQESAAFTSVTGGTGIPDGITAFIADATNYVKKPPFEADDDGSTNNALLRFDTSFVLGTVSNGMNPYGFVGGPGNVYEDVTWTPISRDFMLRKGTLQFDPVVAACFKFEFTSLAPQPYDLYTPVSRSVKIYPSQVRAQAVPAASSSVVTGSVGSQVTTDTAPLITYADAIPLLAIQPTSEKVALPTEALHATDPITAKTLQQFGGLYNFQPWQSPTAIPRFSGVQKHFYETVEIQHTSRVAYFVSISSIIMYRVDYTTNDDTEMYLELFGDKLHLNVPSDPTTTWDYSPGMLRTPTNLSQPVTISSAVLGSKRQVRGVQIATQQSDALQLLLDSDFEDPLLRSWEELGDAAPLVLSEEFNSSIGSTVQVTRRNNGHYWDAFELSYPSWDMLEDSNADPYLPSWDDLEGTEGSSAFGGVGYSTSVPTTQAGRIYAAARVYAAKALTQPLVLQIVDSSGGVVAEADQPVAGGQVTEWFVGYTIGEGPGPAPAIWNDIEVFGTWNDVEGHGTWDNVDLTVTPLDGHLSVQLIQRGNTIDEWFVDNLSLFEDAIVWEVSNDGGSTWWPIYDIRNNPRGAFIFPDPLNTMTIVNQVTNGSFETGSLTGWVATGGTLALVTDYAYEGVFSGRLTPDGVTLHPRINSDYIPASAASTYSASAWVYAPATLSQSVYMAINWFDSSHGYLSTAAASPVAITPGTWTQITLTATAPASTAYLTVVPTINGTPLVTDVIRIDAVGLNAGATVQPYVDGTHVPSSLTKLVWRATGYRPGLHISAVAIRPWYGSLEFGVITREPGLSGGPNLNPTDHFPRVEADPRWQAWHEPVPQDWWFEYRQLFSLNQIYTAPSSVAPPVIDVWLNEHALLGIGLNAPVLGPEIYEDIYAGAYLGHYGVEGGSDIYTDQIGNDTY